MKKNQKALLSFTLAALVFSAGCAFFSENPLLTFIDVLSILSLVLLVGGLVEFLIHGGYFDFMTYSFSSAKNLLTRHPPEFRSNRKHSGYLTPVLTRVRDLFLLSIIYLFYVV